MSRPMDWDVLDLSGDPTPGDPTRVRQLASRFHDFAETAHRAKVAVESLQGDGAVLTWVGLSGDAFREQFGDFPNQVNKLYQSHLMVGDALETYAPTLETAQAQADRALADGRVAAEKLKSLQGALSTAQTDFTGASQAAEKAQAETQAPDPDQVKQAVKDADAAKAKVSGAQSAVNGAQQELDLAKQLADQAKQMRDGAAQVCKREIEDASDAGIQPRSFWQKLGDALKELWNIICEVAKWVALVAGIIGMILGGPLAWIALAAGAILLVKAIVDFAQGKGSVLDLVMGILGIIPGVKGLTSLSKLSALYKAGGLKEIAKAALTGMKTMAKDMVGLVKAAGTGALTIVKKLGDSSASVLGSVKAAGEIVGDAVSVGAAKIGDLFPGGSPKPIRDIPPPRGGEDGFGVLTLPTLPAAAGGQKFAQRFNDLATLKTSTETTEFTKIKADFDAKFQTEKTAIQKNYADQLKVKTDQLKVEYQAKYDAGKLPIEKKYADDLASKTNEIKLDYGKQLDLEKGKLDVKYDQLKATKTTELQQLHLADHNVKLNELTQIHAGKQNGLPAQMDQFDQAAKAHFDSLDPVSAQNFNTEYFTSLRPAKEQELTAAFKADFDKGVADLPGQSQKLYDADLAKNLGDLDNLKAVDIKAAETNFTDLAKVDIEKADVKLTEIKTNELNDLNNKLVGDITADVNVATADFNKLELADIKVAETKFDGLANADIFQAQKSIDTHFTSLDHNLRGELLDSSGIDIATSSGNVKTLFINNGADVGDLGTVVDKNWAKLDDINPNKNLATDVNCTVCVQRFDDYVKTDVVTPAGKIPTIRPLSDIEAVKSVTFQQIPNADYATVVDKMAAMPDNTVGIIGYLKNGSGGGHVMNVIKVDGRVAFVDGQSGRLGELPWLDPKLDELHFTILK
ncbi:putative T7SS-secreted protein [Winogradskya humida]|uniref:Papain fold toxin 1 (Glutamine deamidase) of polymorphic toxin system n=1 Tax=Winogradskya humida TaxID=113566 RepID=A0ABQ3ZTD0_9ACTN|nr:toxin glutamine deamidase domain-containing protein [Actinoplanes humidus]GIE21809.1 hypothetical protein Ahu01nite_049110 [Actinoplanes humidus]